MIGEIVFSAHHENEVVVIFDLFRQQQKLIPLFEHLVLGMGHAVEVTLLEASNGLAGSMNHQFTSRVCYDRDKPLHPEHKTALSFRHFRNDDNSSLDSGEGLYRFINEGGDIAASENTL